MAGQTGRTTIQVSNELARVIRLNAAFASEGQHHYLDRVVLPQLRDELRSQIARMHELGQVPAARLPKR